MAMVRKKQDDKNLKTLRELVQVGGNRQCFDCGQRGPTYVNMTIGSFVCTRCSGVLRGITPPHRVKSISMATFTPEEIEFVRVHGNDECAKTWLGLWDPKRVHTQEQRELMIDKYERKRYFLEPASPLKSLKSLASPSPSIAATQLTQAMHDHHHQQQQQQQQHLVQQQQQQQQQTIQQGPQKTQRPAKSTFQFAPPDDGIRSSSNNGHLNGFNRNGLNLQTTTTKLTNNVDNGNKFTPDGDFVADFGSADIFNASNNKVLPNGGNIAHQLQQHQQNIKANNIANSTASDVNENFADFEHAPIIYNAAGLPMSLSSTSNSLASSGTFNSNSSINSTPPSIDRYAALKDLDEQLREIKEKPTVLEQQHVSANPFKASAQPTASQLANPFQATPHQLQQQQLQQQQQQMQQHQAWQDAHQQQYAAYGMPTGFHSNGTSGFLMNGGQQQHNQQHQPFSGYNMSSTQSPAAAVFGNQRNPFTSASLNSNNPFL